MVYGDALGFMNENIDDKSLTLKKFLYQYNSMLSLEKPRGQYSYVTELMIIMIKCLKDDPTTSRVIIDYPRFYEEIKLWRYYRHGRVESILLKFEEKDYYEGNFYWQDRSCKGISRIFPIILANKNYSVAEIETYKNIIYFNRHPYVILTGLILLRTMFLLMQNEFVDRNELTYQLKNYLINLQLKELNKNMNKNLPHQYSIQFEKEKIQYLIDLDRYKENKGVVDQYKENLFFKSIDMFYNSYDKSIPIVETKMNGFNKEINAIAYALFGLSGKEYIIKKGSLKDEMFIYEISKYLYKLREYKIDRKLYNVNEKSVDIFKLQENSIVKHPVLNNIKILKKEETMNYIRMLVQTKSSIYTFIKNKTRQ